MNVELAVCLSWGSADFLDESRSLDRRSDGLTLYPTQKAQRASIARVLY
jgi:hypothetical protein